MMWENYTEANFIVHKFFFLAHSHVICFLRVCGCLFTVITEPVLTSHHLPKSSNLLSVPLQKQLALLGQMFYILHSTLAPSHCYSLTKHSIAMRQSLRKHGWDGSMVSSWKKCFCDLRGKSGV